MRLFFALEPNEKTTLEIANWRDRQCPLAGRPVPIANLHITLAFLGDLSPHRLERLCAAVDEAMLDDPIPGGNLELDQVGYWAKPGIFWLGPSNWPDRLSLLAARLSQLGSVQGSRRQRGNFQPHITLFRGCTVPPPAPAELPSIKLPYPDFVLLESRQGKTGVSYHPLEHWQLS